MGRTGGEGNRIYSFSTCGFYAIACVAQDSSAHEGSRKAAVVYPVLNHISNFILTQSTLDFVD